MYRVIRGTDRRLAIVNFAPSRPVLYEARSYDAAIDYVEAWEAKMKRRRDLAVAVIWGALGAVCMTAAGRAFAAEALVEWTPPTQNVDGSPLTDLAGYRVYIGQASRKYGIVIDLPDPTLRSSVVTFTADWLQPGGNPVYISMTALDEQGNESAKSNEILRTVVIEDDIAPNAPVILTITLSIGADCPPGTSCNVRVDSVQVQP